MVLPSETIETEVNGVVLHADASGALVWPERRTVAVADLHLEKGSSFARRGTPLPPYDTRATLERLAALVERTGAERVICLGDSFHDKAGSERLTAADAALLAGLVEGRDWVWITGNHDPVTAPALGGRSCASLTLGPLVFRHEATPGGVGEVSGHFHPVATVRLRAGRLTGRCFVADRRRIILPAFGAFVGGLDVFDPVIAGLFRDGFRIHLVARGRIATIAPPRLAAAPHRALDA